MRAPSASMGAGALVGGLDRAARLATSAAAFLLLDVGRAGVLALATGHRIGHARPACCRITEMIEHMGRITRLEVSEQPGHLPPILDLRRSSDPREPARPVTPS